MSVPRVISIDCGSSHSLALIETQEGTIVTSWGRGEDGQLGHGDAEERLIPQAVFNLIHRNISQIYCGAEYSIALSGKDNLVYSWGWGDFGRLGHADCKDVFVPTPIPALVGVPVQAVSCGDTHTLVATKSGALFSFGRNQNGQLGNGSLVDCLEPQQVESLAEEKVIEVACGAEHSVCCTEDGRVYAWGWGRYGNIGDGDTHDRQRPTRVLGLNDVKITKIACGWRHTLAIDESGSVFSWGWSKYGQLGHGDHSDQHVPKKMETLKDRAVTMIAGGWRHSLASDADGQLFAWGWNKFGQLGLGHNDDVCSPCRVQLQGDDRVCLLSSGWRHSVVVGRSGNFYAWGRGVNGQLGIGSTNDVNVPTEVREMSADKISIQDLTKQSHPVVMYSIPASDRYALVPDNMPEPTSTQAAHAVPEHQSKKPRT